MLGIYQWTKQTAKLLWELFCIVKRQTSNLKHKKWRRQYSVLESDGIHGSDRGGLQDWKGLGSTNKHSSMKKPHWDDGIWRKACRKVRMQTSAGGTGTKPGTTRNKSPEVGMCLPCLKPGKESVQGQGKEEKSCVEGGKSEWTRRVWSWASFWAIVALWAKCEYVD